MKKKMTLFGGSLAVVALAVLGFQILFAGSTSSVSTDVERTSVASDRLGFGCGDKNSLDVRVVDGVQEAVVSEGKKDCPTVKSYVCSSKKKKAECSTSDRAAKKEECRKKCDYSDKKTETVDTDDPVLEFN